jgi:hypothetical protein
MRRQARPPRRDLSDAKYVVAGALGAVLLWLWLVLFLGLGPGPAT